MLPGALTRLSASLEQTLFCLTPQPHTQMMCFLFKAQWELTHTTVMTASLAYMHAVCSQIKGLALILDQLLVKQEVNTPSCVSLSLKWKDVKTGCLSRLMLDEGLPILLRSSPP